MGASDRLYEVACEVRDLETREDRLALEDSRLREGLDAQRRASLELIGAIEEARLCGTLPPLPDDVALALAGLSQLNE